MNTAAGVRRTFDRVGIDASRMARKLYQGSYPPEGDTLRRVGFDVLVLCAKEWQPPDDRFPGVRVMRVGLSDSGTPMSDDEWHAANTVAIQVARALRAGRHVLVTCQAGRNRSGLVVALALYFLTLAPGRACVQHVRRARHAPSGLALTNPYFTAALANLP